MDLGNPGQEAVRRLAAALEDDTGKARWPDAVIDDVLAVLVLASAPLDALDPIEEYILAGFSARIGLSAEPTAVELAEKIGAWFVKNPLPEALARDVAEGLRELLSPNNAAAAAAALGAAEESKVPVAQRAAAAGSTRMGVMGRFGLSVPPKDKQGR